MNGKPSSWQVLHVNVLILNEFDFITDHGNKQLCPRQFCSNSLMEVLNMWHSRCCNFFAMVCMGNYPLIWCWLIKMSKCFSEQPIENQVIHSNQSRPLPSGWSQVTPPSPHLPSICIYKGSTECRIIGTAIKFSLESGVATWPDATRSNNALDKRINYSMQMCMHTSEGYNNANHILLWPVGCPAPIRRGSRSRAFWPWGSLREPPVMYQCHLMFKVLSSTPNESGEQDFAELSSC